MIFIHSIAKCRRKYGTKSGAKEGGNFALKIAERDVYCAKKINKVRNCAVDMYIYAAMYVCFGCVWMWFLRH